MKPIVSLIANPSVQRELGLAVPQLKGVKDALEGIRRRFMPRIQEIQKLPESEKVRARPALMRELVEGADEALSKVFNPDQYKRFKQIRLQSEGIAAFRNDAVRSELALADQQVEQMEAILKDGMTRLESLRRTGPVSGGIGTKEVQDEVTHSILGLFTEEQVAKWKAMLGKDFELDDSPGRSPGGMRGGADPGPAPGGSGSGPFSRDDEF